MAQLERVHRHVDTSKSLTVEQLLRGNEASKVSPTASSSSSSSSPSPSPSSPFGDRLRHHDLEEDHGHHQKKSVLMKVKEKAKKLRHSLSKKKHEDGNLTPSWGVSLEDEEEEEEDAEYLGAPMYESELAPEAYKENARQHPRATPVISEKHILPSTVKPGVEQDGVKPLSPSKSKRTTKPTIISHSASNKTTPTTQPTIINHSASNKTMPATQPTIIRHSASNKTMPATVAEKLTPAYGTGSNAVHSISSKIQGLSVSKPAEHQISLSSAPAARKASLTLATPQTPPARMVPQSSSAASKAPRTSSAPVTPQTSSSSAAPLSGKNNSPTDQIWDKGVSVKEYLMNKFEPGEDEKALSQVISEAMSPRRTPGDAGVIEKVREAVTSLLRNDEPSQQAVKTPITRPSSEIPVSTNSPEVGQEENHGRILQTN